MRLITAIIVVLCMVCISPSLATSITVTGNITTNTTWQDTVIIKDGIYINADVTLTILPGSVVLFDTIPGQTWSNNTQLQIEGNLYAHGTSDDPIKFHTPYVESEVEQFYSIKLENYIGKIDLAYCSFINDDARLFYMSFAGEMNHIQHCTFIGIESAVFEYPTNIEIDHCLFEYSSATFLYPNNARLHHNVIWNNSTYVLHPGPQTTYFYNNIIYGVGTFWGAVRFSSITVSTNSIFNNVIVKAQTAFCFMKAKEVKPQDVRYNLYFNCNSLYTNQVETNTEPIPYLWDGDVNSIIANPLFIFPDEMDLRVSPKSPCIDGGDPDPQYNDPDGSRSDIGVAQIYDIAGIKNTKHSITQTKIINNFSFTVGVKNTPVALILANGSIYWNGTSDDFGRVNIPQSTPSGPYYLMPIGEHYFNPGKVLVIK